MLKEAIILAGGIGSRLQSVVKDIPKPMASINKVPFLTYLLEQCLKEEIEHIVLSVGYKHELIQAHFGSFYKNLAISYAIEQERLGTGGGIQNSFNWLKDKNSNVLVLNGDSFFDLSINPFFKNHIKTKAYISIALTEMEHFDRYGTVTTSENKVLKFEEKKPTEKGWINTGIYILNPTKYLELRLPIKHSFETDFLAVYLKQLNFIAYKQVGFFIDIGIPEDYKKAQKKLLRFQ